MSDTTSKSERLEIAQEMMEKEIADIIQKQVQYFNGWKVDDEQEREDCEEAARRIYDYLVSSDEETRRVKSELMRWLLQHTEATEWFVWTINGGEDRKRLIITYGCDDSKVEQALDSGEYIDMCNTLLGYLGENCEVLL